MAVIINDSVRVHRVKDVKDVKEILSTARPSVLGIDSSCTNVADELKYLFNSIITSASDYNGLEEAAGKLIKLNILKSSDYSAIKAALSALLRPID